MAASAELLVSTAPLPQQRALSKPVHEPVDLSAVADLDAGLDGSCTCDSLDAPLTSEAPLADAVPLTSEPPLTEPPLTSEPTGAAFATEPAEV